MFLIEIFVTLKCKLYDVIQEDLKGLSTADVCEYWIAETNEIISCQCYPCHVGAAAYGYGLFIQELAIKDNRHLCRQQQRRYCANLVASQFFNHGEINAGHSAATE